ncbi:MAG: c-type cytochrome [Planctomycetaceae bacterium]|nr:c-type cytochrome [Planctomycetaceae bacterium]MBT6483488.1 c-type cytochrome [Planctomycetaceae bacterium]MBT6494701.1 c-type cytochrome [Planctomycetaceae bacterium]
MSRSIMLRGTVVLAVVLTATMADAQDSPDYFRQNCMNCHTIGGGRLTGPDLKDLSKRRVGRDWMIDFLLNPKAVIDAGDSYAQEIFDASGGKVYMPVGPGMTKQRAEDLLDLIDAESKLEKSQFKGRQFSNKPFTTADRKRGRQIFEGTQQLKAGGASCISCHSMHDTPALGGGRLGPDLTEVVTRLKGRKSLSAWLVAPGTETMQPIFKGHPMSDDEIHSLVAYFEASAGKSPSEPSANRIALLLMGLVGAAGLVFVFDSLWKRRFHNVRRQLVDVSSPGDHP